METQEALNALGTLCLQQKALIASLEAKLDALIGSLPDQQLHAMRQQLLSRASLGYDEAPDETRPLYQQRIASTLQGIDLLLKR